MVGPTAIDIGDKEDVATTSANLDAVFAHAKHLMPGVSRRDIITSFAGIRPALASGDFLIAISGKRPRLVQVAGIQSPGLTASPAIARRVIDLLLSAGCRMESRAGFSATLPKLDTMRGLTPGEMDALLQKDRRFGSIVCRCETVSEAQIVQAIRKGHTTLDGIKFYTRSGMGRCQGGFCTCRILKILARETGKPIDSFTKRGGGSRLVAGPLSGHSLDDKEASR